MTEGSFARSNLRREPEKDLSVYYDGCCPLCRAEIDHYRRCEGADRLLFVDVGRGAPASALGEGLDREAALRRFHVRDADGRLVSGAAAFARLWRALPHWRWLGRLLDLRVLGMRPLLPVAEAAYRLSLPLRPKLARLMTRLRG
jgi:predicted DCC family thiol-disulfide oxidoreductase YuxK